MTVLDERPAAAPTTITAEEERIYDAAVARYIEANRHAHLVTELPTYARRAGVAAVIAFRQRHPDDVSTASDLVPVTNRDTKNELIAAGWTCMGVGAGPDRTGVYWLERPNAGNPSGVGGAR